MSTLPQEGRALPSMFIGSSSEGLPVARTVRSQLADVARITMWNEGFFALGSTFIEALVNELPKFDFAVLILTPDDLITAREKERLGPRDNLVFELGLFTAGLGRSRTFVVRDSRITLPSDLSGVSTAPYQAPESREALPSALGRACDSVRFAVESLGPSDIKTAQKITHLQARQADMESTVKTLKLLVRGIVTDWEYEKLQGLSSPQPFLVRFSNQMIQELARLRALGYINVQPGHTVSSCRKWDGTGLEFDLKQYFHISPTGLEYVRLREEY